MIRIVADFAREAPAPIARVRIKKAVGLLSLYFLFAANDIEAVADRRDFGIGLLESLRQTARSIRTARSYLEVCAA